MWHPVLPVRPTVGRKTPFVKVFMIGKRERRRNGSKVMGAAPPHRVVTMDRGRGEQGRKGFVKFTMNLAQGLFVA